MSNELYKRYRPKTLDKVVGNEHTVSSLVSMLEKENVPHALLFQGPSGCGKTTLARIVASGLGCAAGDLVELNIADVRGIDAIRDIRKDMKFQPAGGDCRVYILDEAHQMSKDAQNAMLKMLEDTLDHVYFMLCTTDPQKLIKTVRTRCTPMTVALLDDSELGSLVSRVAKKEGIKHGGKVIAGIVKVAGGSARSALVLLEKVASLSEKQALKALKEKDEEEAFAIDLCRAMIKRQPWVRVSKLLLTYKGEVESLRLGILEYARKVLHSGGPDSAQACVVLDHFEDDFFSSGKPGLSLRCFQALQD